MVWQWNFITVFLINMSKKIVSSIQEPQKVAVSRPSASTSGSSILLALQDYADGTTLHGIKYVVQGHGPSLRR